MSNSMTVDCSYPLFPIERFGLKAGECESIIAQLNGFIPGMDLPLPNGYLASELRMAAAQSAADHARYGFDLSYPKNDSPEMPRSLLDLADKVSGLASWQQDAIVYYVLGFWDGIRAAADQHQDEMAGMRNPIPQG